MKKIVKMWLKIKPSLLSMRSFIRRQLIDQESSDIIRGLTTGGTATFYYKFKDTGFLFSHFSENVRILRDMAKHLFRSNLEQKKTPYDFSHIPFEAGDIVIDIGGHIGTVAIFLAKLNPEIKVYTFEPSSTFRMIENNIKLNQVSNIVAVNKAITKDGNPVRLVMPFDKPYSSSIDESIFAYHQDKEFSERQVKVEEVSSIVLDSFITEQAIKKIKLFKIDCEGAEYDILYNLSEKVWGMIKYFVMETHGDIAKQDELIKFVKSKLSKGSFFATEMVRVGIEASSWEQIV